jgi:large subunit ribosomal protein L18
MAANTKLEKRLQRKLRVRSKVSGLPERPRLSVFRSNKHVFVQLIDDSKNITLVSASDAELAKNDKAPKKSLSFRVGEALAKKALAKKISKVSFDKSGYMYHGRIKEIAEGARKGGLDF